MSFSRPKLIGFVLMVFSLFLTSPSFVIADSPDPAQFVPQNLDSSLSFRRCVESQRSVAALFLIDTSLSLRKTDPLGDRVAAIQSSVAALDLLTRASQSSDRSTTVFVDFVEFGSTSRRSFPSQLDEWSELNGNLARIQKLVETFADRNEAEDTDYIAALEPWANRRNPKRPASDIGAIELLEKAPQDACQLLIWFTDGKYEIDYRGTKKVINWTPSPTEIESSERGRQFSKYGEDLLCADSRYVDRLRTPMTGRSTPVFTVAVALGSNDSDFSLMRSVAEGTCGRRPPSGRFLTTSEVSGLISLLREAVLGPPDKEENGVGTCLETASASELNPSCDFSFYVGESLTALSVLAVTRDPAVNASLVTPLGEQVRLPREGLTTTVQGVQLQVESRGAVVRLVEMQLDDEDLSWKGTWRVRFSTSNPALAQRIKNEASIHVFGALEARLVTPTPLVRGLENKIRVQLQSRLGQPRSSEGWITGSSIEVQLSDGSKLQVGEVAEDGSFTVLIPISRDDARASVSLQATLIPKFDIGDGNLISLREWRGDLGTLELRDPPRYPLVDFSQTSLTALRNETPVSSAIVIVDATATPEAGGCVSVVSSAFQSAPGDLSKRGRIPAIEWTIDGIPIDLRSSCPIRVEAGKSLEVLATVRVEGDQLMVPEGWLRGEIRLRSASELNPSESEEFIHELSAKIIPNVITQLDSQFAALLMILAVLFPLLLLYGFNLYSARFTVEDSLYVDYPARFVRGKVVPLTESGQETTWSAIPDSAFRLSGLSPGRRRRLSISSVSFQARPSFSPVGEPVASTSEPGSAVISRRGIHGKRGRLPLDLEGAWAFRTSTDFDSATRLATPSTDGSAGAVAQLDGRLLTVLPTPMARARESLSVASTEAAIQIEQVLSKQPQAAVPGVPRRPVQSVVEVELDRGSSGDPEDLDPLAGLPGQEWMAAVDDDYLSQTKSTKSSWIKRRSRKDGRNDSPDESILDSDLP